MSFREEKTFTDAEFIAAFSLILPPNEAEEVGIGLNSVPEFKGFEDATPAELAAAPVSGPRSLDEDVLDLLSLVSESCAQRAWELLRVSPSEGAKRREQFRRRIEPALRENNRPTDNS